MLTRRTIGSGIWAVKGGLALRSECQAKSSSEGGSELGAGEEASSEEDGTTIGVVLEISEDETGVVEKLEADDDEKPTVLEALLIIIEDELE